MPKDTRQRVLSACLGLLKPIAKILLQHGIGYKEFDLVCRQAFVSIATEEFGLRGRRTNVSRVATMTGLSRKEVYRLREVDTSSSDLSTERLSPLADLLYEWATSLEYLDDKRQPRALNLSDQGRGSFQALAKMFMGDVPPGAVRKELVRLGVAQLSGDGTLNLVRRTLIPDDLGERLESAMTYSLKGLADTVAHNIDPEVSVLERRFERFVESRPLTEEEISELRSKLRRRLISISEELDSLLNDAAATDSQGPRRRVGVGLFYTE